MDMVRLEWAHIVAFDGLSVKALAPEDLAELKPTLSLRLQPYSSILALRYAVDKFRVKVNSGKHSSKRLTVEEYRLLKAFSGGCSIQKALLCAIEAAATPDVLGSIETSFAAWAQFGWLTAATKREREGVL